MQYYTALYVISLVVHLILPLLLLMIVSEYGLHIGNVVCAAMMSPGSTY